MKKAILITAIVISGMLVQAQEKSVIVGDVNINELEIQYIELVGAQKALGKDLSISIDFGQRHNIWKGTPIKDKNGEMIEFTSVVIAINYLVDNGWEYINSYSVTSGSLQQVYHYIFKKISPKNK